MHPVWIGSDLRNGSIESEHLHVSTDGTLLSHLTTVELSNLKDCAVQLTP